MPLGAGTNVAYLYDRGGIRKLQQFVQTTTISWSRTLSEISEASVTVAVSPGDDCCEWLGQIRSMRHELVIFRDDERVWEGFVTRVLFSENEVTVQARDMLFLVDRRDVRHRFTDTVNGVAEGAQLVREAMRYDDPNVTAYLDAGRTAGSPTVTTALNTADCTYYDALADMVDEGVEHTTIGRRIVFWPSTRPLGKTALLRSAEDLQVDVTVIEDGLALATRIVSTGGDTWGATTPEPVVTNYATNPALQTSLVGYRSGSARFWSVTRHQDGIVVPGRPPSFHGEIDALVPVLPTNATDRQIRQYNEALRDFDQHEVLMDMYPQRMLVREGEQVSATLLAFQGGFGRIGLRWVGVDVNGRINDRAFEEGPPIITTNESTIFVSGTVPKGVRWAFVQVYRDTATKVRGGAGVTFRRFAMFRGRIEPWFDGNTPDTDQFTYAWTGGPNGSPSTRTLVDPNPDPDYYGLVEQPPIDLPNVTSRVQLEAASRETLKHSRPSPLAVDVPQNAPLSCDAPVSISELVAGTVVPIQTTATCRRVRADTVLTGVEVTQDASGEEVTITLVSGQVWEIGTDVGVQPLGEVAIGFSATEGWDVDSGLDFHYGRRSADEYEPPDPSADDGTTGAPSSP